jgi:site-specific recombinase XerD
MEELIATTLATCPSSETRRVYRWQLEKFLRSGLPLKREGMVLHLQQLRDSGLSSASVAVAVAAIRKLTAHAMHYGLITSAEFSQFQNVGPGKVYRIRAGMRLTAEEAFRLLWLPNPETYWGKSDAAILSLLLGCGLKRGEMANLKWTDCYHRDGRMWIAVGDGNKRRAIQFRCGRRQT